MFSNHTTMEYSNTMQFEKETNELIQKVSNVFHDGLHSILRNYMDRYRMLEETHNIIMQLPLVQKEMQTSSQHQYSRQTPPMQDHELQSRVCALEMKTDKILACLEHITATLQYNSAPMPSPMPAPSVQIRFEDICVKEEVVEEKDVVEEEVVEEEVVDEEEEVVEDIVEEEEDVVEEEVVEDVEEDVVEEEVVEDVVEEEVVEEVIEEEVVEEEVVEEEVVEEEVVEEEVVEEEVVEEEVVEEEVVEEEVVEEDVVEEEVEEEASIETETKEEEEEELFEVEIDGVTYCTNDDENGILWELNEEGEQGKKVGYLKDGEAVFV